MLEYVYVCIYFPEKVCALRLSNALKRGLRKMSQLAGTQIHHYHLQHPLGQGGMSEVYLASDEQLHREVVLKLVEKNHPEHFERFQREVAMIGSLKHDHIMPVFAYGEYASWCYLVMPYLEGGTLHERLKIRGPLTEGEAGILLEQIASALHCAHEHSILHRDVKSSNILLRDDSYAYLADFGLAKEQEGGTDLTMPGYVMGTVEYLAPELQEPFATATPGSDLYALGILLYEMLTGRVPFHKSDPETICWQHVHQPPIRPSLLQPTLSPAVEQVVLRALAKDPSQRFQTPQELAQAYHQAITIESVSHSQATIKVALSSPSSLSAPYPARQPAFWQRLPFLLRAGLVFAVLVLLFSSGFALLTVNMALRNTSTSTTISLFPSRLPTATPTPIPASISTPIPTAIPTPIPTIQPTQPPTPTQLPTPTQSPTGVDGNPWGYDFVPGNSDLLP